MPYRICGECQHPGRLLEHVTDSATVEYYRCDHCGHVWVYEKGKPDDEAHDITFTPPKVMGLR